VNGRWRCRQRDVLAALDAQLDAGYAHAFAAIDRRHQIREAFARLDALLDDRARVVRLLAPFARAADD
jgi:hypothetical protein